MPCIIHHSRILLIRTARCLMCTIFLCHERTPFKQEEAPSSAPSRWDAAPVSPTGSEDDASGEPLPFSTGVDEAHPIACHSCDKAFAKLGHLKRHEQEHKQELPYKCHYCALRFRHKRGRERHMKQHTDGAVYSHRPMEYSIENRFCELTSYEQNHLKYFVWSSLLNRIKAAEL
ncbi:hypothetical protein CAPTEDRAFT_190037 [Capitella teleta]|uniref:C2H2-type domain-containing protein n=1 Tax=Capitella teleta TaxID=283909 RepID=R7UZW9_CAPTE|nr:hypothetical protein CAPTEDRAFT_190037 [Capitella teleta]|eukprot:ELU11802.1 hypothetical protein CAPTEDRAFT_190037 [Capitella teleta]